MKRLVASLQKLSPLSLLIAIDQEGGRVNRLKECFGFPATVSAQYLGHLNQIEITKQYADITAKTLAELGINLNLSPVVDLTINPFSPAIGKMERSFARDPDVVCTHAMEWIRRHHAHHVLCTLKHFPGHGSACNDSHKGFVDVTKTWLSDELKPYRKIIRAGLCDLVMTAHIFHARLDPDWPATLSYAIITDILRTKLGYDGVVISDDMQMKAISSHYTLETAIQAAITSGIDILTFGNNLIYDENITARAAAIIKKLVLSGAIPQERIEQSYRRICRLKIKLKNMTRLPGFL